MSYERWGDRDARQGIVVLLIAIPVLGVVWLVFGIGGKLLFFAVSGLFVFVVVVPVLYLLLPMVLGLFGRLTTPPEDEPD